MSWSDQLFFRKELMERVLWFIRIRWIAVGVAGAGTWAAYFQEPQLPVLPLSLIVLSVLLYNVFFHLTWRRLESAKSHDDGKEGTKNHPSIRKPKARSFDAGCLFCETFG